MEGNAHPVGAAKVVAAYPPSKLVRGVYYTGWWGRGASSPNARDNAGVSATLLVCNDPFSSLSSARLPPRLFLTVTARTGQPTTETSTTGLIHFLSGAPALPKSGKRLMSHLHIIRNPLIARPTPQIVERLYVL